MNIMKRNIKTALCVISALAFAGTGCLKDKDYDDGLIQSTRSTGAVVKPIEIKLIASSTSNFYPLFVDNSNNDTTVQLIPVNLATHDAAPTDLHVTLTQNDQLVADYNANHTDTTATADNPDPTGVVTHFDIPVGLFTVVDSVVVIPKGEHTGYLQIKFKPSDFLGDKKYALAYTITNVAEPGYTISGNSQNGIVNIGIKNKYDGLYSLVVNSLGWAAYGISDNVPTSWPSDVKLITTGATTLVLNTKETGEGGADLPAFDATGAATGFGSTQIEFEFDLATDKIISARNTVPDDGRGRTFQLNTAENSRYDAASQTIYAAFIMKQNGRPNQFFYDTLVYTGPR